MVRVTFNVLRTKTLDQAGNKARFRFEHTVTAENLEEAKKKSKARCSELFPFCNITLTVKEIVE